MAGLFGLLCGLAFTVFCISIFVPSWLWVAMLVYRAFEISAWLLFVVCLVAGPLSLFRKAKAAVASLYLVSSFVFFFFLWTECALFVLSILGRPWLIGGFLFLGIGVIPESLVACVSASRWDGVIEIPIIIGVIVLVRLAAGWFAASSIHIKPS